MLTNLFYYNYYKPYLLHNTEPGTNTRTSVSTKRSRITDKKDPDILNKQHIILNKSLKNEVIDYAGRITNNITALKDSAKYLIRDMEDLNKNSYKSGADEAKKWIEEDLADFVDSFNDAKTFMKSQRHSPVLSEFSDQLTDIATYSADRMSMLGISADENGELSFDSDYFNKLSRNRIDRAIGENIRVFGDVYGQTSQMMTLPMTEHMNFRGLSYHYNYKMGRIVTDTFNLIESGMIVDRVV